MHIHKLMSRLFIVIGLILGLVWAMAPATQAGERLSPKTLQKRQQDNVEYLPNVIVVKFKDRKRFTNKSGATGLATVDKLFSSYNVYELEPVVRDDQLLSSLPPSSTVGSICYVYYSGDAAAPGVAQAFARDANVEYAEPKYVYRLFDTPNDPRFGEQTHLDVVSARPAWDVVKGEQGDAVVAIVDGGTDIGHPDIAANLWTNPAEIPNNGVDDDNNGFVDDVHGWNFANSSNDPTGLATTPSSANHGTHTAGVACAVTDNGIGVAGVSWNATLMPVNAGSPTRDNIIAFGYDGILYAGMNGADIISCSWGGAGANSLFEQEIINTVTDLGALVVAAAGNEGSAVKVYPSAYQHVIAVANTTDGDVKSFTSSFGTWVDLSAPGVSILSTLNNGRYGSLTGTSFSCPLVAGIAALVKTQHPDWNGLQIGEQVRVTADVIDDLNPSFVGKLGKGRANAARAVTESSPAIRISDVTFSESNNNGIIDPGETVTIALTVINYLAAASNVNLTLSTNDNFVSLNNANLTISSIGTLEEKTFGSAFSFDVANTAPSGHPLAFVLNMTTTDYQDSDRFSLTVLPTFATESANQITVTVTNIGRLGFGDADNQNNGIGFSFKDGPNLLFEGALIAGTGATQISDAARGILSGQTLLFDQDFTIAEGGDLQLTSPGVLSDEESFGIFEDTGASNPMNIRVTQETFAMHDPPNDDFVLFKYTVENLNATALENFHFGYFFDWDIDGGNFATNSAGYDPVRRLGYAYDTGSGPDTYVGMSLLTLSDVNYRAIFNDPDDVRNPSWGIYDGYTDLEKWVSISSGTDTASAGPADISHVIAAGPLTIEPNSTIQIGFALLAGIDLNDLQQNADAAKKLWDALFVTGIDDEVPGIPQTFALEQNYPNPFNPSTTIRYQLPKSATVELTIYNVLGQPVNTLVRAHQPAGTYAVAWDGKNFAGQQVASGIYVYRLHAGNFVQTRKMLFLR
ncbi:MAG: S8 family serine peptidase [bacterium]